MSSAPTASSSVVSTEVPLPLSQAKLALEQAVDDEGFNIIAVLELHASLRKEGYEREDYFVFEVCQPGIAHGVLQADPRLGSLMPCRVAVYLDQGRVRVASVLPSRLLGLVGPPRPELVEAAVQVDQVMARLVAKVASSGPLGAEDWWKACSRSFRQAVAACSLGQGEPARKHTQAAQDRWTAYCACAAPDPCFADVTSALASASAEAGRGDLDSAARSLSPVRGLWLGYRVSQGLDSLPERLTELALALESGLAWSVDGLKAHATDPRPSVRQESFAAHLQAVEAACASGDVATARAAVAKMTAKFG